MDWQLIARNWTEYRPLFRTTFGRIGEAELEVTRGERSRLVDKVRDAYHMSQEEATQEVDMWAKTVLGGRGRGRDRAARPRSLR